MEGVDQAAASKILKCSYIQDYKYKVDINFITKIVRNLSVGANKVLDILTINNKINIFEKVENKLQYYSTHTSREIFQYSNEAPHHA